SQGRRYLVLNTRWTITLLKDCGTTSWDFVVPRGPKYVSGLQPSQPEPPLARTHGGAMGQNTPGRWPSPRCLHAAAWADRPLAPYGARAQRGGHGQGSFVESVRIHACATVFGSG